MIFATRKKTCGLWVAFTPDEVFRLDSRFIRGMFKKMLKIKIKTEAL